MALSEELGVVAARLVRLTARPSDDGTVAFECRVGGISSLVAENLVGRLRERPYIIDARIEFFILKG